MTAYEEDVRSLIDLDEDEYQRAVAESLDADDDWRALLDGSIVVRTIDALTSLQIAMQREENRLHEQRLSSSGPPSDRQRTEFRRAKARIRARNRTINYRLQQASRARREVAQQQYEASQAKRREYRERRDGAYLLRVAVRRLSLAIQDHRLAAVKDDLTPEPADRALWALLDEVVVPLGDRQASLTEMLGREIWWAEELS